MDGFGAERAEGADIAVDNGDGGLARRDGEGEAEHFGAGVLKFGNFDLVHHDGGVGETGFDDGMVCEVVEMAVGEPEGGEPPVAGLNLIKERTDGVVGGVDQHALAYGFIGDDIAVGGCDAAGSGEDLHDERIAGMCGKRSPMCGA